MILSPQVLPYTRSRSIIVALIGRSHWTLKPGAEVLRNGTDGEGHADENDPLMAAKVNFALNYSDGIIINNCSSSSSGIRGSSSDAELYVRTQDADNDLRLCKICSRLSTNAARLFSIKRISTS